MNSNKYIKQILIIILLLVVNSSGAFAITEKSKPEKDKKTVETPIAKEQKYIKNIEITGTNSINPELVREKMLLRGGDLYDKDLLQTDLTRIYQMGYFTEKMKALTVDNPDNTITLKIIVEENIPITDFTIEGNTVVSTEELLTYLLPLRGQPQNVVTINTAIDAIQECYAEKGYILARVSKFEDDPDGVVNLKMTEGVINKISITGNVKTKDYVVARNILTEPGMIYNENLIKEDLVRLYSTQAYKDVNRDVEPSEEDPEKYDVTITVQEQRTTTISLGGGLDSATGLFGSVGIQENNFRGRNQRVGISFLAGSGVMMSDASVLNHANLQGEISFFEPYFLNADNSLGLKAYFRDFGSYQVPLAIEKRLGADATVSHRLKINPKLSTVFSLGIEHVSVDEGDSNEIYHLFAANGIPEDLAREIRKEELEGGLFVSLAPGFVYDSRDVIVNPRNGVIANLKFSENIALDNFDKTHGKLVGSIKKYFPVMKKSSFSLSARAGGIVHGFDDVPEVMAFRLGGPYTVRGYRMGAIGIGTSYVSGSAELDTPLLFLDRIKKIPFFDNLKLAFFVDAGKLFGTDSIQNYLYDRPLYAVTAGVGVKVFIPGLGPLSVDYGIPITNPGGTSGRRGYFTFGIGDLMY